jgi:hypothetical protein
MDMILSFRCIHCDKEFRSWAKYLNHIREKHPYIPGKYDEPILPIPKYVRIAYEN